MMQLQLNAVCANAPYSGATDNLTSRRKPCVRKLMHGVLAGAASLFATGAFATSFTYQFISVPGSIQTLQAGLNDSGTVVGSWIDVNHVSHGYVYEDGHVTPFDVPGASATLPKGLNNTGTIVGSYQDSASLSHGFILKNGVFTTLDVPGATSTELDAINDGEQLTAYAKVPHAALFNYLYADGKFTGIPGSRIGDFPVAINNSGTVVGTTYVFAGGKTTPIDIPNADVVTASGVNAAGTIVGSFTDATTFLVHGFKLSQGVLTLISEPGFALTFATGINASNVVAGSASDRGGVVLQGFSLKKNKFSPIVPGERTFTNSINRKGQVAGVVDMDAFLGSPTTGKDELPRP